MTTIILYISLLMSLLTSTSRPEYTVNKAAQYYQAAPNWKPAFVNDKIKIESSVTEFTDAKTGIRHERIIFRYTNLSAQKLLIQFGRKAVYNGICYGCEKTDKKYSVELSAHESKEFSSENKDKTYYIFSRDLKNTITKTLDSFEIINPEITVL